jgi:aminomethyltransferase
VRDGAEVFAKTGEKVGHVTSGGPAPFLGNKGIGMAYIDLPHNKLRTELVAVVRGKEVPIMLKKMPFVPSNYFRRSN